MMQTDAIQKHGEFAKIKREMFPDDAKVVPRTCGWRSQSKKIIFMKRVNL